MTFEDYKKQVELFGKIDTSEKLTFYKRQYESHLLHIEDENYFEPYEERLGDDLTCQYEQNLNRIFSFDEIQGNQFYFIIRPSFEPENLLLLTQQPNSYLAEHIVLTKNYSSVFYANNKVIVSDKSVVRFKLTKALGDKLFFLLDKTITEARQPKANVYTLDGVVYILSKMFAGKRKDTFKHSPNEGSKSGKIIAIMEQLIDCMKTLDNTMLGDIETKIDELKN